MRWNELKKVWNKKCSLWLGEEWTLTLGWIKWTKNLTKCQLNLAFCEPSCEIIIRLRDDTGDKKPRETHLHVGYIHKYTHDSYDTHSISYTSLLTDTKVPKGYKDFD